MKRDELAAGKAELRAARAENRRLFWAVGLFSVFVNLLMLTGPMFMLQVYDRVLGARSVETLTALFLLVLFLFTAMGLLDYARGRVTARIGARVQASLEARVFDAALRRNALAPNDAISTAALRDLDAINKFLSSPVFLAIFDLPWVPVFLSAIFLFHPLLGLLSICGGVLLIAVTLINQWVTSRPLQMATGAQIASERMSDQLREEAELIQALGMRNAAFGRWRKARSQAADSMLGATDMGGGFTTFTKTFRIFLQSAILALGAYIVLQGEMTAGAMIAGSILMGRALAPVEQAVGGWAIVSRARDGWGRLALLLSTMPRQPNHTALPRPKAVLEAQTLTVAPPGSQSPTLRAVSFRLDPGQALGVIGPSGAGKSTLARAICGLWRPANGSLRLDGATLDQYDPDVLGQLIGYLPQRVTLFDGTIAENIARLSDNPNPEMVVDAAKRAAAHKLILDLPEGYDTKVTQAGGRLSGGQIQRIGLARALYGNPVLLVLDEPNANLDNEGSQALNIAVRGMKAAGGAVLIMAHRPAAIAECDTLLVLDNGIRRAFGPREEVLKAMVQNAAEIGRKPGPGGVA
ncbi:ATP-binding cassette subfamily C protein [Rhodobacter aestuarii]|uniref:ATP-binding cassette, subfamily C n=1 Tax=Rhodobacter aestuarii TaxID=453582 RepID=A0A1N7LRS6_9RHOB|nr:type I secretion system permease/ATPase [Rhodobacter aestuarii]PTV95071.1 ATP-binding cassette subfamily C protein [Rhodobacter aestuarii]SIS76550.1 ATP-binding cassette, subfamily C [Rhodobacter aestuarii]